MRSKINKHDERCIARREDHPLICTCGLSDRAVAEAWCGTHDWEEGANGYTICQCCSAALDSEAGREVCIGQVRLGAEALTLANVERLVEDIAQEFYAGGPWGEMIEFRDEGARLITDAHSSSVYRQLAQIAVDIIAAR